MTTTVATNPKGGSSSAAKDLPDADVQAMLTDLPRSASTCADHRTIENRKQRVGASPNGYQTTTATQMSDVVVQLNGDRNLREAQACCVAVELLFCAAFLDDAERLRIATENRLRSMAVELPDADLATYRAQSTALGRIEHQATLSLQRALRRHPLGPWVKRTTGLGEKQAARLIAAIGTIAYNAADGRPRRGPAELWAYCGYVPGQRRRKGERSNWNAEAKMRAFLCAESCIKHRHSPYRAVYDRARAAWVERDTSDGHKHNHALRVTAKAILKDLFLEARRVGA